MPPGFWAAAACDTTSMTEPAPTAAHRRSLRLISASEPKPARQMPRLASGFPVPGIAAGWPRLAARKQRITRMRCLRIRRLGVGRRRSAFGRDQQEWRALALIGPFGMGGDLFLARRPLLDAAQREAEPDQQVDVGRHHAVLFDDAFGQPVPRARA